MVDAYQYGFDRANNRLWQRIVAASGSGGYDEHYAYDGVYQLKDLDRGNLAAPPTGISGTPAWTEDFSFDSAGNWPVYVNRTGGTPTKS